MLLGIKNVLFYFYVMKKKDILITLILKLTEVLSSLNCFSLQDKKCKMN